MYKQVLDPITNSVSTSVVLRTSDNSFIPNDVKNKDWVAYQAWLADGNIPLPPGA